MLARHIDVPSWTSLKVKDWLAGLCDDSNWLKSDEVIKKNICGKELLLMVPQDLEKLGVTKVNIQERILEAIEDLRFYSFNINNETLQSLILRLACQARMLQRQLPVKLKPTGQTQTANLKNTLASTDSILSSGFHDKQRVSLETLASVSNIVTTVQHITDILNRQPFSKHGDYRSMKSLLLALSIELTSTAQRDQFVERPNDIIEKSSKALADYCDRIVYGTRDPLLIQPFQLEAVKIRRNSKENDIGLVIKSHDTNSKHIIDKILPLSPAKKTNKLSEGDEIIQFNEYIVGWSTKNVEKLMNSSLRMDDVILMVKKCPNE